MSVSCAPRATQTVFRAQQGFQSWAILIWCDSLPMEGTCLGTLTTLAKTFAEWCCRWRLFPPQTPFFSFSFLSNRTYTAELHCSFPPPPPASFLMYLSFLGLSPNESLVCWNLILAPASQRTCTETNPDSSIYTYHHYVCGCLLGMFQAVPYNNFAGGSSTYVTHKFKISCFKFPLKSKCLSNCLTDIFAWHMKT